MLMLNTYICRSQYNSLTITITRDHESLFCRSLDTYNHMTAIFSTTHSAVIVFSWMVKTTSESMKMQFKATNNDWTVVTVVTAHLPSAERSLSSSVVLSASYQTDFSQHSCTECTLFLSRTFLHAHVLWRAWRCSLHRPRSVSLSSSSKHGPHHLFHSQDLLTHTSEHPNKAYNLVQRGVKRRLKAYFYSSQMYLSIVSICSILFHCSIWFDYLVDLILIYINIIELFLHVLAHWSTLSCTILFPFIFFI